MENTDFNNGVNQKKSHWAYWLILLLILLGGVFWILSVDNERNESPQSLTPQERATDIVAKKTAPDQEDLN